MKNKTFMVSMLLVAVLSLPVYVLAGEKVDQPSSGNYIQEMLKKKIAEQEAEKKNAPLKKENTTKTYTDKKTSNEKMVAFFGEGKKKIKEGFRGHKWSSSPSMNQNLIKKTNGNNNDYIEKTKTKDVDAVYVFKDNKLKSVMVLFTQNASNQAEMNFLYAVIKTKILDLYGKPTVDDNDLVDLKYEHNLQNACMWLIDEKIEIVMSLPKGKKAWFLSFRDTQ